MSEEVDLFIAIEHGLLVLAGIRYVSASPCSEEVFRRVQARLRRDADIAAHYARRYLESGAPVPRKSFFEVLDDIFQERGAGEASGAGAEHIIKLGMPGPGPRELPFHKEGRFHAASAAAQGSIRELTGALGLFTLGLQMFLQWRVDPLTAGAVSGESAP